MSNVKKLRKLIKNIKAAGPYFPKKASSSYFSSLAENIMEKVNDSCVEIRKLMVDFVEEGLEDKEKVKINNHIESCKDCSRELEFTKSLLLAAKESPQTEEKEYFTSLTESLKNKTINCEKVIEELVPGDEIPAETRAHIELCTSCREEMERTDKIIEAIKTLSVKLPDESFFSEQLLRINSKLGNVPSERIAVPQRKRGIMDYFNDMIDTFKVTVMQPHAAIMSSILVVTLLFGGTFYNSPRNIEQRQSRLSKALSKSSVSLSAIVDKSIFFGPDYPTKD